MATTMPPQNTIVLGVSVFRVLQSVLFPPYRRPKVYLYRTGLLDRLWRGVMQLSGYAGMRICGYMRVGDRRVYGMRLCGFRWAVVFTTYASRDKVLVSWFFHTLCHQEYRSLRILRAETLEITEDHGMLGWFWIAGD